MTKNTNKTLFIIAGASGEIGTEFVKRFASDFRVIAISRKKETGPTFPNLSWIHIDLTDPDKVNEAFSKMGFTEYKRVVLIHAIGSDKFENIHYPKIEAIKTIDKKVYGSNVNTYKYIALALIKKISLERKAGSKTKLVLSMIGSVADRYGIVFLTSFSESKNIVRSYIQYVVKEHHWISGLVINISSTITKSALKVRPHADTKYWLKPAYVVRHSAASLLHVKSGYREIDIFKEDPNYESDYYVNNDKIFKRWSKFVWGKQ